MDIDLDPPCAGFDLDVNLSTDMLIQKCADVHLGALQPREPLEFAPPSPVPPRAPNPEPFQYSGHEPSEEPEVTGACLQPPASPWLDEDSDADLEVELLACGSSPADLVRAPSPVPPCTPRPSYIGEQLPTSMGEADLELETIMDTELLRPESVAAHPQSCRAPSPMPPRAANPVPWLAQGWCESPQPGTVCGSQEARRPFSPGREPASQTQAALLGPLMEAMSLRDQRIDSLKQKIWEVRQRISQGEEAAQHLEVAVSAQHREEERLTADLERHRELLSEAETRYLALQVLPEVAAGVTAGGPWCCTGGSAKWAGPPAAESPSDLSTACTAGDLASTGCTAFSATSPSPELAGIPRRTLT